MRIRGFRQASIIGVCITSIVLVALIVTGPDKPTPERSDTTATLTAAPVKEAPTPSTKVTALADLVLLDPGALADVDVAAMNLLCAEGLPGAEGLDVNAQLAILDKWAEHVRSETERNLHRFHENPAEYNNLEADFRALMLIVVLQADLGVHYNPQRINDPDFTNSRDLFIHGMTPAPGSDPTTTNGGTCASMPVLYVAIGRRLGYPMKLAVTKGHVFARWDAPDHPLPNLRGRFNIEGTNRGLSTLDDSHYANMRHTLTDAEINGGWYLRSLAPAEELAIFLMQRGHCLEDTRRLHDAQVAYAAAVRLAPTSPEARHYLAHVQRVIAGTDPDGASASQRDADQATQRKRQRNWTENHIRQVQANQQRKYSQPPPMPGPGTPSINGG